MKLILMRHGESIGNVTFGYIAGRRDPGGLTHLGKTQIIRSCWELRDEHIDHVYVSPVVRAQETARIVRSFFPQAIYHHATPWLTELDHGIFEGHRWWEIIHKVPPGWRASREDFETAFPDGESMRMLSKRVWEGYEQFQRNKIEGTTLLISHQAVISTLRYFLNGHTIGELETKEKQREFVRYLKEVQLPNAGLVFIDSIKTKIERISEIKRFEPIKPRHNNISWYVKGVFGIEEELQSLRQETASGNAVYEIKLKEKEYLAKVQKRSDSDTMTRQIKLYDYLHTRHFKVPIIEFYDTSKAFYKDDVMIQDFISGTNGHECLKKHAKKFILLLGDIYDVLHKIHKLSLDEVRDFWFPQGAIPFRDWKIFMQYNINLTIHAMESSEFTISVKKKLRVVLASLRDHILDDSSSLSPIHGDPSTGNFIITHKKNSCQLERIIDFEWARIGDPLWDHGYFWGWLERNDKTAGDAWKELLQKKIPQRMNILNAYRILFHAWTVRDVHDYPDDALRQRRGKQSASILKELLADSD